MRDGDRVGIIHKLRGKISNAGTPSKYIYIINLKKTTTNNNPM